MRCMTNMQSSYELMNTCVSHLLENMNEIRSDNGLVESLEYEIYADPFRLWGPLTREQSHEEQRGVFALCLCHYSEIIFQLKKQISFKPREKGEASAFSILKDYFREKDIGVIIHAIPKTNDFLLLEEFDHPFMKHYEYDINEKYFRNGYETRDSQHGNQERWKQIEPSTIDKQTSWYSAYTSKGRFLSESVFTEQLLRPAANLSTMDVVDFILNNATDDKLRKNINVQFVLRVLQMLAVCCDDVKLYRPAAEDTVLRCLHKYQYLRFQLIWNCLLILQPGNLQRFDEFIDTCLKDAVHFRNKIDDGGEHSPRPLEDYIKHIDEIKRKPTETRKFIESTIQVLKEKDHREKVIMAISKQRHTRYARIQECIDGIGPMLTNDSGNKYEKNITTMQKTHSSDAVKKLKHLHRLYEVRYKPVLWPGLLGVRASGGK